MQRLMRRVGITALHPKKGTSRPGKGHKVYPYLLKRLEINRQVYCSDITYIPMARGFVYLVVIMDWFCRKVLSWRLSNTMESDFCVDALEEAISCYGAPKIFNTDQGAQFTSEAFTSVLKASGVKISMDGKGRWVENVFVERLWRSIKYEEIYLRAYESVNEVRSRIGGYLKFYNSERKHQSLEETPDQAYFGAIVVPEAARSERQNTLKRLSENRGPFLLNRCYMSSWSFEGSMVFEKHLTGRFFTPHFVLHWDSRLLRAPKAWGYT